MGASDLLKSQTVDSDDQDPLNQSYPEKKTDPKRASFKIKSRPGSNQGSNVARPILKNVQRDLLENKGDIMGMHTDKKTGLRRQSGNPMNQTMQVQKPKMDRKLDTIASTTNLKIKKIAQDKEIKEEYQFTQGMKIVNH